MFEKIEKETSFLSFPRRNVTPAEAGAGIQRKRNRFRPKAGMTETRQDKKVFFSY